MGPSLELLRGAGLVDIRTASLYHEVHGTGPTVLLIGAFRIRSAVGEVRQSMGQVKTI